LVQEREVGVAEGKRYNCTSCGRLIEAWDEGNPYFLTSTGKKKYAYHPDPKREECIGVDSPNTCLACGTQFSIDSNNPILQCPKCKSMDICNDFELESKPCPFCKDGHFAVDRNFHAIS